LNYASGADSDFDDAPVDRYSTASDAASPPTQMDALPAFLLGLESAEQDKIAPAIASCTRELISPMRNKTAKIVSNKGAGSSYTYKYSTLDVINDMIREPMGDNGLFFEHKTVVYDRRKQVFTRLRHVSGQWCGNLWPVTVEGNNQDVAGTSTYAKRQNICLLLNIASGEGEDDANRVSGRVAVIENAPLPNGTYRHDETFGNEVQRDIQQQRVNYVQILKAAKACDSTRDAMAILKMWQENIMLFRGYRDDSERRPAFDTLLAEMTSALSKGFGPGIGLCFRDAALARTKADIETINAKSKGDWATDQLALRKALPQAWGLFAEHCRYCVGLAKEDPDGIDGLEKDIAQVEKAFATPAAKPGSFAFPLVDETGEVCTDVLNSRQEFAKAFAHQWRISEQPAVLAERNKQALEGWSDLENDFLNMLMEEAGAGQEEQPPDPGPTKPTGSIPLKTDAPDDDPIPDFDAPATPAKKAVAAAYIPTRLTWPQGRSGKLDLIKVPGVINAEFSTIGNEESLDAWLEANGQALMELPETMGLKVEAMVIAKRKELAS
jgi:hypothetical protein